MEFISTIVFILIFFIILILGHEVGHFAAAKFLKLKVQEFGLGLPPKIFSFNRRGTEYSLNAIPFGGFVKIPDIDYLSENSISIPKWKKTIVFSSGVLMNFFIAWIAFSVIFMIGTPKGVYVGSVVENYPAHTSGLQSGDKLVDFESISPVIHLIESNPESVLNIKVERRGEILNIAITPRNENNIGKIGAELIEAGFSKEGVFQSFRSGFEASVSFTKRIIDAFIFMFAHRDFTGSAGPIGVFSAIQIARDMGLVYFLQLMGVVSLNLMIINFLPLPALDGGHMLFLFIEKIRGKPLNKNIISRINSLSYGFLLILIFIVTIKDIIRLF